MRTTKNCPKCRTTIAVDAQSCECGWSRAGKPLDKPIASPSGYQQCDWLAGTERCRYPGTLSSNVHAGGPWYCRHHWRCDSGHFGAQVVEASRDYRHQSAEEREAQILERMNAEAQESLKAKGLARKPGESMVDWRKRCNAWFRAKQQGIGKMEEAA